MMARPLLPPAHARAMSVLLSSSSGVGTYGGLKICIPGERWSVMHCQTGDRMKAIYLDRWMPSQQP